MNHFALICDDNYALPTAVCIQSIVDNSHEGEDYCVHVCTFGLCSENSKMLESLAAGSVKVSIDLFDQEKMCTSIDLVDQKTHVSSAALIKFELANYFASLDIILYLDSDIIVKDNISELFTTDVSQTYLAASFEYWDFLNYRRYTFHKDYGMPFYFNSGVMLLNLQKMREDNIPSKLWDYKLNHTKTRLMDQECFNAICGETAVRLSIKWNFNPVFYSERNLVHINTIYREQYSTITEMLNDMRIIHYVGKVDKPWVYETARMRNFWDRAFANSGIKVELQLKEDEIHSIGFIESLRTKKELFGMRGVFCFIINKIFKHSI